MTELFSKWLELGGQRGRQGAFKSSDKILDLQVAIKVLALRLNKLTPEVGKLLELQFYIPLVVV